MRERITFIHGSEDAFNPQQLDVQKKSLQVKSLKAAREDRLTFGLYELPQELWRVLKQCHELHLRWVSEKSYPPIAPFVAKASPGLHVLFTPHQNQTADLLCPLLRKSFGGRVECTIPKDSFINLPVLSERFASSSAYQYHGTLPSLQDLVTYIQIKVCANDESCKTRSKHLIYADYLDVDYDTISQSFIVSVFWHTGPSLGIWDERIDNRRGSVKVEVGVLANEKATQPEELSLGGFLVVLGEDKKPNPTLFSFPSRHHAAAKGSTYTSSFIQPTGLHPTLRLTLPSAKGPPSEDCALHAYLTLPSSLFVDKYQLSSPNFLASNNLHSIRALSGETDLEAPDWATSKWGSALLLELEPPTNSKGSWHADIPLHLRYMPPAPAQSLGRRNISTPWPVVFWACPTDEGTKMNTNPFDRVNLGYDGLFGPRTMFYHLQSTSEGKLLTEELTVPAMDLTRAAWVDSATVGVVLLGFVWVCWKLSVVVKKDPWWRTRTHRGKTD